MYRLIALIVSSSRILGRLVLFRVRSTIVSRIWMMEEWDMFHFLAVARIPSPSSKSCRIQLFCGVDNDRGRRAMVLWLKWSKFFGYSLVSTISCWEN